MVTTFNDLERPLTPISRSRHFSTLNISETTRDRAIVTIEGQQEVVCTLSKGDIYNDLDGPLTRFSRSLHFWSRISQKRCVLGTELLKNTNRKPYIIYRIFEWYHFQWPSVKSDLNFKVTTFLKSNNVFLNTKLLLHNSTHFIPSSYQTDICFLGSTP